MKILFLCRFLPYARARDSGRLDTYHYLVSLSQHHEVALIAFVTAAERQFLPELQELCTQVVAVPFDEQALSGRLWRLVCRQLLTKVYGRVYAPGYQRALKKLMAQQRFDIALIDGMMGLYGRWLGQTRQILDEVDIFSHMAYQYYQQQHGLLGRVHAWQDWLRTTHKEMVYIQRAAGVLVRSEKDEAIIRDLHPYKAVHVLRPWFEGLTELQQLPLERPEGHNILFMGAMNIASNIQAAVFFAREVFPLIQKALPAAKFYIVGNKPTAEVQTLAQNPAVIVTGEVPDLLPYYQLCAVNVVPLFIGGGVIVKTLNGLASGRPTVTTAIGNSGTGAQNGRDLIVVEPQPKAFAAAVLELLCQPEQWQKWAQNGRDFITQHYNWEIIGRGLAQFLRQF